MVAGLAVFLLAGSVRIGAGNWIGRRMSIRQVWARFLDYVADLGASPAIVAVVVAAAVIALGAAAYALWLAFDLKDASTSEPSNDAA